MDISLNSDYEHYLITYAHYAMFDRAGRMTCFTMESVLYVQEVPCTRDAFDNLVKPSIIAPEYKTVDLAGCIKANAALVYGTTAPIGTIYSRHLQIGKSAVWVCYKVGIINRIPHSADCLWDLGEYHIDPTEFIIERNGSYYYKPPTVIEYHKLQETNASSVTPRDYDYDHN